MFFPLNWFVVVCAGTLVVGPAGQSPEAEIVWTAKETGYRATEIVLPSLDAKDVQRTPFAGAIAVEIRVDADGRVSSVHARSGPTDYARASEKAAREWRFPPVRPHSCPIRGVVEFSFARGHDALWVTTPGRTEWYGASAIPQGVAGVLPKPSGGYSRIGQEVLSAYDCAEDVDSHPEIASSKPDSSVVVQVYVDESGKVLAARALTGHPSVLGASIAAAMKWRFTPTKIEGRAVPVVGTITFKFRGDSPPEALKPPPALKRSE